MMKTWFSLTALLATLSVLIIACTNEPQKVENNPIQQKAETHSVPQRVETAVPQKIEKNPATLLLGKWDRIEGTKPEHIEFLPDDTLLYGKDIVTSIHYRLIDSERLEIKDAKSSIIITFKVTDDTLLLDDGKPDQTTYRKVP